MSTEAPSTSNSKAVKTVSGITVRLCGDSGDGMQLLGTQLTNTTALAGNDIATFPDFPAEIRAPRGTRAAQAVTGSFKANQVITSFSPPSTVTVGAAPVTISAVGGGSSAPVLFSTVSAPSICTVSGNVVTIVGAGICALRANQAGDSAYNAAPEASASIVITQAASAAITWAALSPASVALSLTAPFTVSPLATGGGSSNPVSYASATPLVCTVSGTSVSMVGIGTCTVTASQLGDANYATPAPVSQSVTIFATLDVDASGVAGTQYHATTDGLLIMRYLLNVTGPALTAGLTGPTAVRTDPAALLAHLNAMRSALDVDGNTVVDAATDGVLILRYLLGIRGSALIAGAVGSTPTPSRPTAGRAASRQ